MKKTKQYNYVRFSPDVVQEALEEWRRLLPDDRPPSTYMRVIEHHGEQWGFDSDEEFFAEYRGKCSYANLNTSIVGEPGSFIFTFNGWFCRVEVALKDRPKIERVYAIFEKNVENSRIPVSAKPAPPPPTIFIGHGRSGLWRDLKEHLTDKQGYRVIAYEVGARAGHTIRDILEDMLAQSSFALLVLTSEDETTAGKMRARQNVVHELGLFQGRLGFPRAIALVENGTELMSNLDGIQQLQFSPGNIAEVYGDVLATIRREFGDIR